ncbi:MAG: hypothetical protein GKR94_30445 [Gammaproteobacteria bacterium]|nr:hypothetical protein [Gammaproteobacteria bacterium]
MSVPAVNKAPICDSWSDAVSVPRIVRLDERLYVVAFQTMKIIPAHYMIRRTVEQGRINPSTRIVESSSGTFALGSAIVCRQYGLALTIVTGGDPS